MTSFKLDDSLIKPTGTKVRCSNCKTVFMAYPAVSAGAAMGAEPEHPDAGPSNHTPETEGQMEAAGFDASQPEQMLNMDEAAIARMLELDESAAAPVSDGDMPQSEMQTPGTPDQADEDLQLDFDLGVDLEKNGIDVAEIADMDSGRIPLDSEAEDIEEIALSELEQVSAKSSSAPEAEADEIDLSELEQTLEEHPEAPEAAPAEETEPELELDLGGGEDLASSAPEAEADEIDLSELEQALEEHPEAPEAAPAEETEPELELDLDGGEDLASNAEDIETELADLEPTPAESDSRSGSSATGAEGEIDLSDIEKILESEEGFSGGIQTDAADGSEEEEINVAEIEAMLSGQDEAGEDSHAETEVQDLDLDFDIEEEAPVESDTPETFFAEDTSEFDFSEDEEQAIDISTEAEEASSEHVADDAAVPPPPAPDFALGETPLEMDDQPVGAAAAAVDAAVDTEPRADDFTGLPSGGPAARRKSRAPMIILLVVVLLMGGGYGAFVMLGGQKGVMPAIRNLKIPFISDLFAPQHPDPGNLKIKTYGVTSRFVESRKAGRLFVISGKITNGYDQPRKAIKISGKLYVKGKKLAKTETVYGGNVISGLELRTLDAGEIHRRLNRMAPAVRPGRGAPFMIVFSKLPQDLSEFTVEVVGSAK